MDYRGVYQYKDHAHQREKEDVNGVHYQALGVGASLLQLVEQLSGALVLKNRVGEREGVLNTPRVNVGARALDDDVNVVVLEGFSCTRDKSYSNGE